MADIEVRYLLRVTATLHRWMTGDRLPRTVRVRVSKENRAEFCAGMAPHCDRHRVHMCLIAQGVCFSVAD